MRFPVNLSKDDYDFVIKNLKLWERSIVAKDTLDTALPASTTEGQPR